VACPEPRPTIRAGTGLSTEEAAWLQQRRNHTGPALRTVLSRANIKGIDVDSYLQSLIDKDETLPSIGIAFSGGGYRAMMNGAGALAAFDDRTANATSPGQLGGILQAATYISGLSGGSWLVGSIYLQNFTTVESITSATSGFLSSIWQFNETILRGKYSSRYPHTDGHLHYDSGPAGLSTGEYYRQVSGAVDAKLNAGYETTITDFWGRALSYQLYNASDGGPGRRECLWVAIVRGYS